MKILTAEQLRAADAHTIKNEPISSIDLMERASKACADWIVNNLTNSKFDVFCGVGNNGGDGLAIARMLYQRGYDVRVFVVEFTKNYSKDFIENLTRVQSFLNVQFLSLSENLDISLSPETIIIDAIFGSGLNRPTEGIAKETIEKINSTSNKVISIDMPSGLFCEDNSTNVSEGIISADVVLTFQLPKLSLLLPENAIYCKYFQVLPIGLDEEFINKEESKYYFISSDFISSIILDRDKFSHKGTYGHALIIAGSKGKMGAALLAGEACLRSGAGLLSMMVPRCGELIVQTGLKEAMLELNEGDTSLIGEYSLSYDTIGIGPGIGTFKLTIEFFESLLSSSFKNLVLDADALNILSKNKELIDKIPSGSVLTPHPKEFERLVGKWSSDIEKLDLQKQLAKQINGVVIVKGAHTSIADASGNIFFNSTGNPGMATGGSGDVLTGIITGLLAQGYSALDAAILGVYFHGLAGDKAAEKLGENSIIASDLIKFLKIDD